jgi:hypothetical protein
VREENELFYDINLIKDGPAFLTPLSLSFYVHDFQHQLGSFSYCQIAQIKQSKHL